MPVVVVYSHADDPDAGVGRLEERRREVGRAVVRNLQHVGAQICPRLEKALLCLDLDIAGQQDANTADGRAQHQRGVVGIRPGVVECRSGRHDVQLHAPNCQLPTHLRWRAGQSAGGEPTVHESGPGDRLGERPGHDQADATAV